MESFLNHIVSIMYERGLQVEPSIPGCNHLISKNDHLHSHCSLGTLRSVTEETMAHPAETMTRPLWDDFQAHKLEETFKKLSHQAGVIGTILVNNEGQEFDFSPTVESGIAMKSSLDNSQTVQYSALVSGVIKQVKILIG